MLTYKLLKSAITAGLLSHLITGCMQPSPTGSLVVKSNSKGRFEIYRVASEKPFQFVSESIGHFNESVELTPGQYLILADCSSAPIIITPNSEVHLEAHSVDFLTPTKPHKEDLFSIQCDRLGKTGSRQYFTNKYSLNILSGKHEILVGMVPLPLDLTKRIQNNHEGSRHKFRLGSVRINSFDETLPVAQYFVSPENPQMAITEPQDFGRKKYLLPGNYILEVNGTVKKIIIQAGEDKSIEPSFLRVVADEAKIDLDASSRIKGSPSFVELNGRHFLDLNETYPVLPGNLNIRLNGSNRSYHFTIAESESIEKTANSLILNNECSPWEWTCLGSRSVYLYEKNFSYPFAKGVTDVPIIYFEQDVSVSVQGSREIKYQLRNKNHTQLELVRVNLVPIVTYRAGSVTDLVRIEATSPPLSGYTLDLSLVEPQVIPLFEGTYNLAQFVSTRSGEGDRKKQLTKILISKKQPRIINYKVILSERQYRKYKSNMMRKKQRRSSDIKAINKQFSSVTEGLFIE